MKFDLRRALSPLLSVALLASLAVPAAASEALGEDLKSQDTTLHQETQLSTNVFWSTAYSDLRTENLITYTPNESVTPIITYGDVLTDRYSVSAAAKTLEAQGYRVVAGINGDFYNVGNGLPIGIVVTQGQLHSSDGGYYAIGFRADGTAVLGKPSLRVTADLGYDALDESGYSTQIVRQLSGVNKARVSTGGIYLYTYEFNDRHTTGNTEPGIDVVCTIEEGRLAIGEELTLTVDQVLEASSATAIGPDQVILSANLQSSDYYTDALRNLPVGSTVTLNITASSEEWNDVEYAVGALYSLLENGQMVEGLPSGSNPRTAVGQKADGTLIFYTIDGRKSGHSIGATMAQVAERLLELGCVTALCLDGGGSTTLSVTSPDSTVAQLANIPSDGTVRSVSNQIFLVAPSTPSGQLSHFYVQSESQYVLAGSKVGITASGVDTNYIPLEANFTLEADDGDLDGDVLLTPDYACDVTVTASQRGKSGSTTVHVIDTPDTIALRTISAQNSTGTAVTSLSVAPGTTTALAASAVYRHISLKADAEAFTWTVSGEIGTIDQWGQFTATAPGSGTITVSAGGRSVTVPVTVSKAALRTVEDFETAFSLVLGSNAALAQNTGGETVRYGKASGKLVYDATEGSAFLPLSYTVPTGFGNLLFWVYGDGSGNVLALNTADSSGTPSMTDVAALDFTGWRQLHLALDADTATVTGLTIHGQAYLDDNDETAFLPGTSGTLYLDQLVASYVGHGDTVVPDVTAALDRENWQVTAAVSDDVDGMLSKSAISVSLNGQPTAFTYNDASGRLTVALPGDAETCESMRVTITARDASGNIGRASVDVASQDEAHKFTDIDGYWAASYADFLYTSGITTGYADGTFRPGQYITRAQFAVMLYRYLGLEESQYEGVVLPFADNGSIPSYALPAIRALYSEGVITGSTGSDGRLYFNPGANLTRAQAATMIGRTQEKGYATVSLTFTDADKIPSYAVSYIQTMAAQGIIGGYADGTFRPGSNITRGQMAKILYNLL